jgi:quinol monooxygenase YgiN
VTVLVVRYKVRDFGAWRQIFDEQQPVRRDHGARRHWVYRPADDWNAVVVAAEFPSQLQGQAYLDDPRMREAMQRAGVEGEPHVQFGQMVEAVEY